MVKKSFTYMLLTAMMWLLGGSAWAIVQDASGVYQIATAQDLADFAGLVNAGNTDIKGAITADIDYTSQTAIIGADASNRFYGTLDGQGHTVTINMVINEANAALIRNHYGIVRNLCVDGTLTTGSKGAGGIVSCNYGVIEGCVFKGTINTSISGDATTGGICGYGNNACVVRDCLFAGKIVGANATNCGGMVGWLSGPTTIENCLSIGEMDINMTSGTYAIARNSASNGRMKNNYCLQGAGPVVDNGVVELAKEDILSGKAAYLLGWGQTLNTGELPLPYNNNARVYATADDCQGTNAADFTNSPVAVTHTWEGNVCSVCGKVNPDVMTPAADGYYEISTADQLVWFAQMVNGGADMLNVRLTADIDMAGVEYPMIGTTTHYYRGHFDGQHHVIKGLNLTLPTTDNVGFFGNIAGSSRVENITFDENCYWQGKTHIGPIGQSYGAGKSYIGGIINYGECTSTPVGQGGSGDAGVGGIVGNCPGGNVGVIDRCAMLGKVSGTSASQISGWCGSNQFTIQNCWSISYVPDGQTDAKSFFREGSGTKVINCAQVYGTQVTKVALEDVASGAMCWVLNGKSGDEPVWFQKVGVDQTPVLTGSDVVYQVGTKKCDGTMGDGFGYSNENTGFIQEDHQIVDGFCSVCGSLPVDEKDGYLLVGTAAALKWVADQVNEGKTKQNFRLTADIDLSDYQPWTPIGNDTYKFAGNMDGGRHTISNMIVKDETLNCAGLFGTVASGNFSDLIIDATCSVEGVKYCGALIGHSYGGATVNLTRIGTMCDVTCSGEAAAGLIGNANNGSVCNITSCWTTGKISAGKDAAAFSGWEGNLSAQIKDSWTVSEIEGYQDAAHYLARGGATTTIINCYGPDPCTQGGLKNITADGVADGSLCFDLNGDQKEIKWFQTLGEGADATPVPWDDHKQVYAVGEMRCDGVALGNMTYTNDNTGGIPPHTFENGFCSVCGTLHTDYKTPVNGYYELATAQDILWFAELLNVKGNNLGARLTEDIDMGPVMEDFKPLGNTDKGYCGTFDGQGHVISNFEYVQDANDAGFIRQGAGGMTLKNIIFDSSCSITTYGKYAGLVGGSVSGDTGTLTFENVGNEGNVEAGGENAGGIIGCNHGSSATYVFKNCYTTGKIVGLKENGAITGWAGTPAATLSGCWSVAEVIGPQAGRDMIRYGSNAPKISKCYSTSEVGQFTHVDAEEVENGSLCWKLNGKSFLDVVWYQTPGSGHPSFNAEEGLVYDKGDEGYACVTDDDSYNEFRDYIIASTKEAAEATIATQQVIDNYVSEMEALAEIDNLTNFLRNYRSTQTAEQALKTSAAAYKAYDDACQYAINYLAENEFNCEERDLLVAYLNTDAEASEAYPNGTYLHIWDIHTLTDEEIAAETKFVNDMLTAAVAADYQPGTEITDLMVNATLADGFNGWTVDYTGSTFKAGGETGMMPAAEAWNATYDMTQKLENMKPGVYMLQTNAAWRPYADITANYYSAMIKLNDAANYVMAEGEDFIATDEAVDGVNCHITGTAADYKYVYGDDEGYVPQGPVGCSYAFTAGRYVNYTATTVGQDSLLTVGIESKGTGFEKDWTGFGNFRLFYLGSEEQANEKLAVVLDGYAARAETIINFAYSQAMDYAKYPNISEQLKGDLEDAIAAIATAESGVQKIQLIQKFSDLFRQVYECRKAYTAMIAAAERVTAIADQFAQRGLIDQDAAEKAALQADDAWNAYIEGTVSTEEALAMAEKISQVDFLPPFENDAYQLSDGNQLRLFSAMVNSGSVAINGVLTADIDMDGIDDFEPIGFDAENPSADNTSVLYRGHFDGQGHRISNLVVDMPDNVGVGLFGSITTGAVIENLILDATCAITGKDRAGIIGRSTQSGKITLRKLGNEGTVTADIAPAGILGNANASSNAFIYDCYSTGAITGRTNATQIVGWLGTNIDCMIQGCWSTSEVTGADNDSKTFFRSGGTVPRDNNYSTIGDGSQAPKRTAAAFESGEVTFLLNGKTTENPTWFQTLGEDVHPVFDNTHKVVAFEDGMYYNIEPGKRGDLNDDKIVDGADIVTIVNYVNSSTYMTSADLDNDGVVDGKDIVILVSIVNNMEVKEFNGVLRLKGKKYFVRDGQIVVEND